MKHTIPITFMLVAVFLVSQFVGLVIIQQYVAEKVVDPTSGEVTAQYSELPLDIERPHIQKGLAYIYITGAIIVGTLIALVLIKFRSIRLWKTWFFLSVLLCLTVALKPLILKVVNFVVPLLSSVMIFKYNLVDVMTLLVALSLAYFKIFKHNVYLNNLTEVFIYGGLSAIFVPIIDLKSAFILLGIISLYDMYAVWKSKHMVKLAQFQTQSKVFAGLSIPYGGDAQPHEGEVQLEKVKHAKKHTTKKKTIPQPQAATHHEHHATEEVVVSRTAILGGGDIGFPMFFAGVVMNATTKPFWVISFIPICAAIALFGLLTWGQQNRFYPAMPFISAGCIVGYLLTLPF